MAFCSKKCSNPLSPNLNDVLDFLAELFYNGKSYSVVNTARSALSTFISLDGQPIGTHPLVKRLVKGVFNLRPALPKYKHIWDVGQVLQTLEKLTPVKDISLRALTLKLTMLLALLTGQRVQTLQAFTVNNIFVTENSVRFSVQSLLKTSRPGRFLKDIELKAFSQNKKLCVVTVLKEYLKRTEIFRNNQKQLLLSYIHPHKPVSRETISRWICKVLVASGVDTDVFSAHSTRSAAVTAAKQASVPINTILSAAGWQSSSTFARFYDKPINKENFGARILRNYSSS
jgi:integrase